MNVIKQPLVSIIIPCYNAEKYIEETLTSIENQTYKNIEVICVNDGSTDNTESLLTKWKNSSDIQSIIITKDNQGVSASRNVGIDKSNGKYIMFLDADDMYNEKLIMTLVNEVENKKKDTAYCRLKRDKNSVFNNNEKIDVINQNKIEVMNNLLYNMSEISFCCFIYNKKIIDKNNIRFDEKTHYGEDREFNWMYLCHCDKVSYINNPLFYYRINKKSATKSTPTWKKTDSLMAVKRTENYLKKHQCKFYNEYKDYMYSRVMWSTAKVFAIGKQKQLYNRLIDENEVKKHMKRLLKDKQKSVVIGSILFLINPKLFYFVLSKIKQ